MQSLVFHFAKQKGFNIMKTDKELLIEASVPLRLLFSYCQLGHRLVHHHSELSHL